MIKLQSQLEQSKKDLKAAQSQLTISSEQLIERGESILATIRQRGKK